MAVYSVTSDIDVVWVHEKKDKNRQNRPMRIDKNKNRKTRIRIDKNNQDKNRLMNAGYFTASKLKIAYLVSHGLLY